MSMDNMVFRVIKGQEIQTLINKFNNNCSHSKMKQNKFKCTFCEKEFAAESEFRQHVDENVMYNNLQCNVCDEKFLYLCGYGRHIKMKTKEGICKFCGAIVKGSSYMCCGQPRKFDCETCPRTVNSVPENLVDGIIDGKVSECCALEAESNAPKSADPLLDKSTNETAIGKPSKTCATKRQPDDDVIFIEAKKSKLECTYCETKFCDELTKKEHVKRNSLRKPSKCHKCKKEFLHFCQYGRHIKINATSSVCKFCKKIIKGSTHMRCGPSKEYECGYCTKNRKPMDEPSKKTIIKCNLCEKKFSTERELLEHTNYNFTRGAMKCNSCKGKFNYICEFGKHIMDSTKTASCYFCKSIIEGKSYMSCGLSYFKCKTCFDLVKSRNVKEESTTQGSGTFGCQYCKKNFRLKSSLVNHEKTHTNSRPLKCDQCCSTFIWPCDLEKHSNKHNIKKNYSCSYCRKKFILEVNLLKHMKIHVDEKENLGAHMCTICKKGFNTYDLLRKHAIEHSQNETKPDRDKQEEGFGEILGDVTNLETAAKDIANLANVVETAGLINVFYESLYSLF